jgi:hypothetical protein
MNRGKWAGRGGIELPAVNPAREVLYHPKAAILSVAPGPIGMVELIVVEDSGPVEEVVDQAVDGNQVESHSMVVPARVTKISRTRPCERASNRRLQWL